jgi:hypothetical protein
MDMADVKLTPRQTAQLLAQLDHSLKFIHEARQQLIVAMANRRAAPADRPRGSIATSASRKRTRAANRR